MSFNTRWVIMLKFFNVKGLEGRKRVFIAEVGSPFSRRYYRFYER